MQARQEDPDTELATSVPPPADAPTGDVAGAAQEATTETAPGPSRPPSRAGARGRRIGLVAGLALAGALVAALVGLQARAPNPSDETRTAPTRTDLAASATPSRTAPVASTPPLGTTDRDTPVEPREPRAASPSTRGAQRRPKDSLPAKGLLQIVVEPWGNVWIDDKWMGRAPLERWVKPGRHVVQAGHETPMSTRTIDVSPGAKRRVEMSLEP